MLTILVANIKGGCGKTTVATHLAAASAVVLESGLSFLGLGVLPPAPSWGLMIAAARSTMTQAPLLLLWPCLALSLTILAMNALCDALRDATDPHRVPDRRASRRQHRSGRSRGDLQRHEQHEPRARWNRRRHVRPHLGHGRQVGRHRRGPRRGAVAGEHGVGRVLDAEVAIDERRRWRRRATRVGITYASHHERGVRLVAG